VLAPRMENFASWYRRLSQENMDTVSVLFKELSQVIPGFTSFSFKDDGLARDAAGRLHDMCYKRQRPIEPTPESLKDACAEWDRFR